MGDLVFDAEAVRELWEHAKNSKHWRKSCYHDGEPFPCLMLAHDEGVYFTSGGIPYLYENPAEGGRLKCVHAEGCNPATNDDSWDSSRELVGGDDFVEFVPIETIDMLFAVPGLQKIVVNMTETHFAFGTIAAEPKRTKAEPKRTEPFVPSLEDI